MTVYVYMSHLIFLRPPGRTRGAYNEKGSLGTPCCFESYSETPLSYTDSKVNQGEITCYIWLSCPLVSFSLIFDHHEAPDHGFGDFQADAFPFLMHQTLPIIITRITM
jgi:hypothetical protein